MNERFELIVVGGGPAGLAAVRAYRAAGAEGAVALISDEGRAPYRRPPLSKELLRGDMTEADLPLESDTWFDEQRVRLISGRAVRLDPLGRLVTLSGGRLLTYGSCVLATGAEPVRPAIVGGDDPAVRVLRSIDQFRDLTARLAPGVEVVVVGAGFLGCEIAASLAMRGHSVALVSNEPGPNHRRLGREAAGRIAGWLRELGVSLAFHAEVSAIRRRDARLVVDAGEFRTEVSMVVMATGVAPRSELVESTQIELVDGAIPVDATMCSVVPGILAAGDVALAHNATAERPLRVEHWGDALTHGAIAGSTAAGQPVSWKEVPGFWSTIGSHTLKYTAWGDGYDASHVTAGDQGAFTVRYERDGQLVGLLAHDDDAAYERARELIAGGQYG